MREDHTPGLPVSCLEAIGAAVIVCDGSGKITYVNHVAAALLGYGAGELTGQPVERLVPFALRAVHEKPWSGATGPI